MNRRTPLPAPREETPVGSKGRPRTCVGRPFFFSGMSGFDHLDNRSGFWIDPPDGRSGAKRTIQPPLAHLPNFLRTLHGRSSSMPLTGRPAEHLRGSRHVLLTSSTISWFLTQKRETTACGLDNGLSCRTASPSGLSSRERTITPFAPIVIQITVFAIVRSLPELACRPGVRTVGSPPYREEPGRQLFSVVPHRWRLLLVWQTAKQKLSL